MPNAEDNDVICMIQRRRNERAMKHRVSRTALLAAAVRQKLVTKKKEQHMHDGETMCSLNKLIITFTCEMLALVLQLIYFTSRVD